MHWHAHLKGEIGVHALVHAREMRMAHGTVRVDYIPSSKLYRNHTALLDQRVFIVTGV